MGSSGKKPPKNKIFASQKFYHDIDFEIAFYEGLLQKRPRFQQAMMALGDLYTKKGWVEKGLAMDRALSALRPDDPFVFYNLACSYSLLGRIDLAFGAMRMAIENGYDDFDHLRRDEDLVNLRQDPRFPNFFQTFRRAP